MSLNKYCMVYSFEERFLIVINMFQLMVSF